MKTMKRLHVLFTSVALAAGAATTGPAVVVTSTADSGPGSLRAAIDEANTSTPPVTVQFNIPGGVPRVIAIASELPVITNAMTIDGTTQPGYTNNAPAVVVTNGAAVLDGPQLICNNSVLRGLYLTGFTGIAVRVIGSSNRIEASHIIGNGYGVFVSTGIGTTIGGANSSNRNVISGNSYDGIYLAGPSAAGTLILGNSIGVAATNPATIVSNHYYGIFLMDSPGNVIGGYSSARQFISGNGSHGIYIYGQGSSNNWVFGNYIGIDAGGFTAVPNGGDGILVSYAANNVIGGTNVTERNVISGNNGDGVFINSPDAFSNSILGNYIGVSTFGSPAVPNLRGVVINNGGSNLVGGANAGAGNIISGNRADGINVGGPNGGGNVIRGNLVGLTVGSSIVSNNGSGISVYNSPAVVIGGAAAGDGNTVSGNSQSGIYLSGDGLGSVIQGNLVGCDASGFAKPNRQSGIEISASRGFTIGGTNSGARNVLSGNNVYGLYIHDNSADNRVEGNHIGINSAGNAILSNTYGVVILRSTNNVIGGASPGARNVISGNMQGGVWIRDGTESNAVVGNYIGVGADGTTRIPNAFLGGSGGVVLDHSGEGNRVGGASPSERNIISGNTGPGVYLFYTTNNVVIGNFIGVASNGITVASNGTDGVLLSIRAVRNRIGGSAPGEGNVISGNGLRGIRINGDGCASNAILGNLIGVTAAGLAALTNGNDAISIDQGVYNAIGGTNAAERNVINGRDSGVYLNSTGTHHNAIEGNYIGLDINGNVLTNTHVEAVYVFNAQSNTVRRNVLLSRTGYTIYLNGSNTVGNVFQGNYLGVGPDGVSPRIIPGAVNGGGIYLGTGPSGNLIGGTNAWDANVIAYGFGGIVVFGTNSVRNALLRNSIYSNTTSIAIDLQLNGSSANDAVPDADLGPNYYQNYPVLTNVVSFAGSTLAQGYLASAPSLTYRIEFFGSDNFTPIENHRFLGWTTVTTAGSGTGQFSAVLAGYTPTGKVVTATATDPSNNTSEAYFGYIVAAATDADNDKMPNYYESQYGLNPAVSNAQTADADGDGVPDIDEYIAGTVPNNSNSLLEITEIARAASNEVTFATSAFRNYDLQFATQAVNNATWSTVLTNVPGNGVEETVADGAGQAAGFYRVRAKIP